jgi:hypothetical protein
MTAGALLSAVHRDSRDVALPRGVTALAVSRRERLEAANEGGCAPCAARVGVGSVDPTELFIGAKWGFVAAWKGEHAVVSAALTREDVAARAIRLTAVAKALLRLLAGVSELSLFGMTRGAALGRHFAHRPSVHVVTLGTSHLGLGDVYAMTAHRARSEPRLLNVQAAPIRSVARTFAATARQGDREHERQQQRKGFVTLAHRHRPQHRLKSEAMALP